MEECKHIFKTNLHPPIYILLPSDPRYDVGDELVYAPKASLQVLKTIS